eukprot:TRINITY_DN7760_c1_g2_i1.p1 TRINITY_DN7760_c1_g2~~TRINITY_DN7760_c1_g2_i1.p1  ORF type:complete len:229 (+),score=14.59 TRINITY_DN7760_c1_g2_i1:91-687(+)
MTTLLLLISLFAASSFATADSIVENAAQFELLFQEASKGQVNSSSSTSLSVSDNLRHGFVKAHNIVRRRHCVPPLAWDSALAALAKIEAEKCDRFVLNRNDALYYFDYQEKPLKPFQVVASWLFGEDYDNDAPDIYDYLSQAPFFSNEKLVIYYPETTGVGCGLTRNCAGHEGAPAYNYVCLYSHKAEDENKFSQLCS